MDLCAISHATKFCRKCTKIATFRHLLRAVLVNSARKMSADKYQRTLKLSGVSAREALFHFELESQVKTLLCTTKKL